MLIPYLVQKGSFRPLFDTWIAESKLEIKEDEKLRIDLKKSGGYPAENLKIVLSDDDQNFFQTDWEYEDWTRFPARIRALATSLRDQNLWGSYFASHENGEVVLRKIGS